MSLADLIKKRATRTATHATFATPRAANKTTVARVATVAVAELQSEKCENSARDFNCRDFPFAAEKLDELRAIFGDGVRVGYARQGNDETGRQVHSVHVATATDATLATPRAAITVTEAPAIPTPDCNCGACRPTRAALKYRQKEPGDIFEINRHGRFRQPATYRRDLEHLGSILWPGCVDAVGRLWTIME